MTVATELRRATAIGIACASACSAPAPTAAVARPEHVAVAPAPLDASPPPPVDGASASLFASCTRSEIKGRTIGGVDIVCGGYTLSDVWTLNGPRCAHACVASDLVRSVRGSGGAAATEPLLLEGMPEGTLLTIDEKGATSWFLLVSPRLDRTVTCRRAEVAQADPETGVATIARCKAMLVEWLGVDRPDRELCDRVADHIVALSGPGPGDTRVRQVVVNGCLGSTRAWAECALAKTTIESEAACNALSDPRASGASPP